MISVPVSRIFSCWSTAQINPWMQPRAWKKDPKACLAEAKAASNALKAALKAVGAQVETIGAVRDLPDLVFPANAAVVLDGRVLPARFRHPPAPAALPAPGGSGW